MDIGRSEHFLQDARTPWIIAVLICVLFLVTNLPWQLDDYDQAKQAYTSFEMAKDGRWFYQQTPHDKVATKPPLIGWISAGIFEATRSWDIAWRLPSFLAAIALAIFIFRAASSAYGSIPGLIALSAFGFNLLTPRLATLVRTDMPLALVIFLIGLQIWKHARDKRGWNRRDRLWLFLLLTAAMLIKGPIVYAFLFPGVLIYVWSLRKIPTTARGCGWWPWLGSLSIFLIWVIGGILFQHGFFEQVVMREFVGRFGETIHRSQPFYFYLPHLIHKFAPWSLLMIALAIVDLRALLAASPLARGEDEGEGSRVQPSPYPLPLKGRGGERDASPLSRMRAALGKMSPETFWLICWSLGGLLAMSLIPSKRVDRIFPVIPPLCLLLAVQIAHALRCSHGSVSRAAVDTDSEATGDRSMEEGENGRSRIYLWAGIALAFSILFTGVYAMSKVVTGYRSNRNALVVFGRQVRDEVEKHHWRYEVVWSGDEGLLLYLRRPHFIKPERAVTEWNLGHLDALVVPAEDAPMLMRELHDAALSQLKSETRKDERDLGYLLITR